MTDRTWIGVFPDDYGNASSWSPNGVPSSGDTAIINGKTVTMTKMFQTGLTVRVNAGISALQAAELDVTDSIAVGGQVVLTATTYGAVTLQASGLVSNRGSISFGQSADATGVPTGFLKLLGANNRAGAFTNASVITLAARDVVVDGSASELDNDGSIILSHPASDPSAYSVGDFELTLNGTGTVHIGAGTEADFNVPVGAGQVIAFQPGTLAAPTTIVERPETFAASFANFVAGSRILLSTPRYDGTNVSNSSAMTTLAFTQGGTTVASLKFQGIYTADELVLSPMANGTLETVTITTTQPTVAGGGTVANAVPGLPVYRFFDTVLGTHFFTADPNEAGRIAVTRPDLVSEGVGLRAVNPVANDPNTAPVYRFFDTVSGTHFFTASENEKATILATRPDLTFEPTSTFAEHITAQPGDVAVYRYFDSVHGTHFYTADAAERASIMANRADLDSEGIGFYAPSS